MPEIEKNLKPQKREKPVSRNVLQTKGHTAIDYDSKRSAHKPSGSLKSRKQLALNVLTKQNTSNETSSRILGRKGSDKSRLIIGIAVMKNNYQMKRNDSKGYNELLKDRSDLYWILI